jgi:arylformamidase
VVLLVNEVMKKLVDLSHSVEHGMITYPGLPGPIICDFLSREASKARYAEGTTFHIGKIDMVANTGTYIDSPFHRYADGKDLSELALESIADLEGVVCRAGSTPRAIGPELFSQAEVTGKAVLIHTGWAELWGSEHYFEGHPFLTSAAAEWLKAAGAALVGIDSLNIDDTAGGERPVHSILLGAGIPIVEHLCYLEQLPDKAFKFHAVPVKVKGLGTFPVRAYAMVET